MNLLKTLATVSSMTLLSRILGFIRDAVFARVFGAGLATDAFFVAFKLPNLLRRTFAEGAFSQAFVPILSEYKQKRTQEETQEFVACITGALASCLFVVTAIGMLAAPLVLKVSAPGFYDNTVKASLAIELLHITFPYILFISLSSLAGSVLNSWGQFSVPAFTPTLLNLSFIIFSLYLAPYFHPPIMALAWAVFFGGVLQLVWQLPFLKKIGMLVYPKLDLKNQAVWRVIRQMGPAIFAVSIAQISLLINTIFASFLPQGSISWIYYADRLMEFPTGLLGVALGTILLPSLSKHAANNAPETFSALLDWGIRLTLLLAIPATVGLVILSGPLLKTLFMYGKFTESDVLMTQRALIGYAIGLVGLILIKVLAPGFYARQNIKTPVRIAMITLLATQAMNIAFIFPFQHAGLALSIGLASCLNAALLFITLRRHRIYHPLPHWGRFLTRITIAVLMMAIILLAGNYGLPINWAGPATSRTAWLLILISAGAVTYFGVLFMLGLRPHHMMRHES